MALINTIHGPLEETSLARTVGFEDRPTEFVVWVEWKLEGELVRRDAHVILKQPSATADALVGNFGSSRVAGLTGAQASGAAGGLG